MRRARASAYTVHRSDVFDKSKVVRNPLEVLHTKFEVDPILRLGARATFLKSLLEELHELLQPSAHDFPNRKICFCHKSFTSTP